MYEEKRRVKRHTLRTILLPNFLLISYYYFTPRTHLLIIPVRRQSNWVEIEYEENPFSLTLTLHAH